jgi:hypothetical protein
MTSMTRHGVLFTSVHLRRRTGSVIDLVSCCPSKPPRPPRLKDVLSQCPVIRSSLTLTRTANSQSAIRASLNGHAYELRF